MERSRKKKVVAICLVIALLITIIGVSYAFATLNLQGTRKQIITAGNLSLVLDEDENNLTLEEQLPMYDEVGMIQNPFTFRLINETPMTTNYTIKLVDITAADANKLDTSIVKYGLTKDGVGESKMISELENGVIDSGTIAGSDTIEYELRLWIDSTVTDNSSVSGKTLSYRIDVEATQVTEYTVELHANGGEGEDQILTCTEEEDCTLTTDAFTRENYTLVGWESKDGKFYANNAVVPSMPFDEDKKVELNAVWGINYIYNQGEQYTDGTGGWTYTRTCNLSAPNTCVDSATFDTSYMQWSEIGSDAQYGYGYFQNATLMNMKGAKTITFEYTAPTIVWTTLNEKNYYPTLIFNVLNSSGSRITSETVLLDSAKTSMQTITLDVSQFDLSNVSVRINCETASTPKQQLVFRLYSAYVTY